MNLLLIAFITGATSGSLGCLATQAGLLAGLLPGPLQGRDGPSALPIALFLAAKLLAYTALGALLGAFGAVLHLSIRVQAILMIAIGVFMVLSGLRMLDLHPVFRRFVLETPAFLRRFIRHRTGRGWMAPIALGLLTIGLPCGVAQAMMATALASGSARQGGAILFAFTLGTSPLFFGVTYLAARLSNLRAITPLMAILLMILGLVPIQQGLTLLGAPVSFSRLMDRARTPIETPSQVATELVIHVGEGGYTPKVLHAQAGRALTLTWITQGTDTCARSVVIRGLNAEVTLPSQGRVPFTLPPQKRGSTLDYSCSMGMYQGQIVFDKE